MNLNQKLAEIAHGIFEAGLKAVDPFKAIQSSLCLEHNHLNVFSALPLKGESIVFDLSKYKEIAVCGAGKASARMAMAIEDIFGDRIKRGIITVKYGHTADNKRVEVFEAGHPVPDINGCNAALAQINMLDSVDEKTLVIALMSGGGSALLPLPAGQISLEDKIQMTRLLLALGADIGEINTIRKHISAIKGGQLVRRAFPATVICLILSDVIGDRLDVIASGATVGDPSTYFDAKEVLLRRGIWEHTPPAIRIHLENGIAKKIHETPKPADPIFEHCHNILVGNNELALQACCKAAQANGFNSFLLSSNMEGEACDVGRKLAAIAKDIRHTGNPIRPPACVIAGGETTVYIKGNGLGGRNQELALAAALELQGEEKVAVLSAGTDGTDGPTDAAGAIAFGDTIARARAIGLDAEAFLKNNDSYHFFDAISDLIKTGPTYTNVMDIQLVLVLP